MFKNILIFGHSNIGDVVYDLAVVNPLRKYYPEAKISFLTSSKCQDVIDDYRGIHKIILFDHYGRQRGLLNRIRFTMHLRKEKFDLVIVFKGSLNYLFLGTSNVWCVSKSSRLVKKHPVDCCVEMLRLHGLKVDVVSFDFNVKREDDIFCDDFLKLRGATPQDRLIGILPLAAWSLKSWPIDKWNRLAEILNQQWGIKMINLGKFPDNEFGRRFARKISNLIIPADNTTLRQAKALLKRCQMFIGPDSSLLHLASCMGIETVGLYGPTPYERFYPYFHQHNIVSLKDKLPCMPCYPGNKPSCCTDSVKHDFGSCMHGIEVEDVVALIKARMDLK